MTRSDVCPCAPTAPEPKGACQLGHVSLPGSRPPGYAAASRPDPVTARKLRRPGGTLKPAPTAAEKFQLKWKVNCQETVLMMNPEFLAAFRNIDFISIFPDLPVIYIN